VQVNGKLRGNITLAPNATEAEAVAIANQDQTLTNWLEKGEIRKVIYVPGRILNFICST
jgi:leucyl-tRNA synthetase